MVRYHNPTVRSLIDLKIIAMADMRSTPEDNAVLTPEFKNYISGHSDAASINVMEQLIVAYVRVDKLKRERLVMHGGFFRKRLLRDMARFVCSLLLRT